MGEGSSGRLSLGDRLESLNAWNRLRVQILLLVEPSGTSVNPDECLGGNVGAHVQWLDRSGPYVGQWMRTHQAGALRLTHSNTIRWVPPDPGFLDWH